MASLRQFQIALAEKLETLRLREEAIAELEYQLALREAEIARLKAALARAPPPPPFQHLPYSTPLPEVAIGLPGLPPLLLRPDDGGGAEQAGGVPAGEQRGLPGDAVADGHGPAPLLPQPPLRLPQPGRRPLQEDALHQLQSQLHQGQPELGQVPKQAPSID